MKVFGLTGGIGAGKSEAGRLFGMMGIPVIEADAIAKGVLKPPNEPYQEVIVVFGKDILDKNQEINASALASIVFSSSEKLKVLNEIVHPRVVQEVQRRLNCLAQMGCSVAVVCAALLLETGLWQQMDGNIVVTADEELRIERTIKRSGMTREEVLSRMKNQASEKARLKIATYLIDNSGDFMHLKKEVAKVALLLF
jgi:dephospho-CoA kinase